MHQSNGEKTMEKSQDAKVIDDLSLSKIIMNQSQTGFHETSRGINVSIL